MRLTLDMPETIGSFADYNSPDDQLRLKELVMFDLIHRNIISFGKAAEFLGISKIKLITDLGKMGISYFDMTADELLEDCRTAQRVSEARA